MGRIFPCYDAHFVLNRRYGWYLSNVLLVATLIDWMSLALFMFDHADGLEIRVNLLLSLVFVQIAFKFTLTTTLPKLDYNTLLDEYILTSFLFLALMLGGVCAVSEVGDAGEKYDAIFSIAMPAFLVLKLLRFSIRVVIILCRNRQKDRARSFKKELHQFHRNVATPRHAGLSAGNQETQGSASGNKGAKKRAKAARGGSALTVV